ncbi:MAG: hypothetical protein IJ740_08190 [Ruminococcus sp.]|nr:hypothetical protein [Ruminococcus sp.]
MGAVYATVEDIAVLGRPLTAEEQAKAPQLLEIASALLRRQAKDRRSSLDDEIAADEDLGQVAKKITVRMVVRSLDASAESGSTVSAESQSGLGYSASLTYFNPGEALYTKKSELKELGLLKQRCGVMEVYGSENTADQRL